jgi:DNA-directed RNA polymerase specialized sigma24 family protein
MKPSPQDVELLLTDFRKGDPRGQSEFISTLYKQLRAMAAQDLRSGSPELQPEDLAHEAYLRLFNSSKAQWAR